jgi:hypothetical protein
VIWQAELTQRERLAGGMGGGAPHVKRLHKAAIQTEKMLKKAQEGRLIAKQSGAGDPRNGSDAF